MIFAPGSGAKSKFPKRVWRTEALDRSVAKAGRSLQLLRQCLPQEAPDYLNRIGLEADRLDKLIGQLLTLARIDSGVDVNQRETFNLTNLVQEVAADGDFEARANHRAVKVIHAEACTMSGVPEMLRSAIENVVRNAIRHTPAESSVEITIERRNSAMAPRALLRVRDFGPGVPPGMLTEIFVPFRRGQEQPETHGAGLGLAIADRIVTMLDGRIRAENVAGGGLSVEMELPLVTTSASYPG